MMPRNISFSLTTKQFRDRTKTVTRRLKWDSVKAGDILMGVEKAMGLKPGEKMVRLGLIRVTEARNEPLQLQGFPEMSGAEFVEMFCKHMKVGPSYAPKRIEFEYVDEVAE